MRKVICTKRSKGLDQEVGLMFPTKQHMDDLSDEKVLSTINRGPVYLLSFMNTPNMRHTAGVPHTRWVRGCRDDNKWEIIKNPSTKSQSISKISKHTHTHTRLWPLASRLKSNSMNVYLHTYDWTKNWKLDQN